MSNNNNNIIGPFTGDQWNTILDLRRSIKWMSSENPVNYRYSISKYKNWEREIMQEVAA